jgi:hypothetical protein
MVLLNCNWGTCWCVQWVTLCGLGIRTGKRIYVWKDPAVETAGYHNPMPTALTCADRHMIGVASQFIGWVFMDTYKWKTEPRSGEKPAAWKKKEASLAESLLLL